MLLRLTLLAVSVAISGCSRELLFGADSARSVISDLYTAQALDNVGLFLDNRYAIPQQVTLGAGQASITSTLGTGISPAIAFRAIAITGLTLTNQNAYSQNWGLSAVADFDQIARLQLLYQYALGLNKLTFSEFEQRLSSFPPKIGTLSATLGELPEHGFILHDENCPSSNPTTASSHGHFICFLDGQVDPLPNSAVIPRPGGELRGGKMKAVEVRSLFVAWTIGIATAAHTPAPKDTSAEPAGKPPAPRRGPKNDVPLALPEVRPRQNFQLFQPGIGLNLN